MRDGETMARDNEQMPWFRGRASSKEGEERLEKKKEKMKKMNRTASGGHLLAFRVEEERKRRGGDRERQRERVGSS